MKASRSPDCRTKGLLPCTHPHEALFWRSFPSQHLLTASGEADCIVLHETLEVVFVVYTLRNGLQAGPFIYALAVHWIDCIRRRYRDGVVEKHGLEKEGVSLQVELCPGIHLIERFFQTLLRQPALVINACLTKGRDSSSLEVQQTQPTFSIRGSWRLKYSCRMVCVEMT